MSHNATSLGAHTHAEKNCLTYKYISDGQISYTFYYTGETRPITHHQGGKVTMTLHSNGQEPRVACAN